MLVYLFFTMLENNKNSENSSKKFDVSKLKMVS